MSDVMRGFARKADHPRLKVHAWADSVDSKRAFCGAPIMDRRYGRFHDLDPRACKRCVKKVRETCTMTYRRAAAWNRLAI